MQNGLYSILKKANIIKTPEAVKKAVEKQLLGFEDARDLLDSVALRSNEALEMPDVNGARLAGLKELAAAENDPMVTELEEIENRSRQLLSRLEGRYGSVLQMNIDQLKVAIPNDGIDIDQLKKLEGLRLGK